MSFDEDTDASGTEMPGKNLYLGPYEEWNFGAGRDYTFPAIGGTATYLTALAEFVPGTAGEPMAAGAQQATSKYRGSRRQLFWLPTIWRPKGKLLQFIPFVLRNDEGRNATVEGLRKRLAELSPQIFPPVAAGIKEERFRPAFPVNERAMNLTDRLSDPDWKPDPGLRRRVGGKRITVMAVIDDGIPFAQRNFRGPDGTRTRIEFCWLQSAPGVGKDASPVRFGREFTRECIDGLIRDYGHDEDLLYRMSGATQDTEGFGAAIDRYMSHGAHVMDLATGFAPERGEEPREDIRVIAVQLPSTIAWDTSGFGKDMYMLAAIHYIFDRARIISEGYSEKNLRLVINFSYGFSGGRHDGGTELEAAIHELVEARRSERCPTALVLPAGNMFLDRLHARIDRLHEGRAVLPWRVQPNDRTSSYLEIWFGRKFAPGGWVVELVDPLGVTRCSATVEAQQRVEGGDPIKKVEIGGANGAPVGQMTVDRHRQGRWRVLVALAPTEVDHLHVDSARAAETGLWNVIIRREAGGDDLPEPIECFIQRDSDPEPLRSGSRQSYFDDPANLRYADDGSPLETDSEASVVRRFGSLNGLATAGTTTRVAGYRRTARQDWTPGCPVAAHYSSAGPMVGDPPHDAQVDCSSLTDRSSVLSGTIAAGTRSGSISVLQGTSAAAPFVARRLAAAFAVAADKDVAAAEAGNYLELLKGPEEDESCAVDEARLGRIVVEPHWQPGEVRRGA